MKNDMWNKAIAFSLFLHILLVPLAGCFFKNCFSLPVKKDKIIELEMVTLATPAPQKTAVQQEKKTMPVKRVVEIKQPIPTPRKNPTPVRKQIINKTVSHESVAKTSAAITDRVASSSSTPAAGNVETASSNNTAQQGSSAASTREITYLPPQLLRKVDPSYPEGARQSEREGTVLVYMQVLENGRVGEVNIRKSSGHPDLDQAAIKAVKKWRFVPAKDRDTGQPVSCFTSFPVVFRLT